MTTHIDPDMVCSILTVSQGHGEALATQLCGRNATGAAIGPSSWETEADALGEVDSTVAQGFVVFIQDQAASIRAGLTQIANLLQATHDAAQALLDGHQQIAQQIAADQAGAPDVAGGLS